MLRLWSVALLCCLAGYIVKASGATVEQPHSRAQLISELRTATPGVRASVGLLLELDAGWHVYWKNPGDSGMATAISWSLPPGTEAGPILWPAPHRIDTGPITSYGYSDRVLLPVDIAVPASFKGNELALTARADWLVCKEICIPASADFKMSLPIGPRAEPDPERATAFADARAQIPQPLDGWSARATRQGADVTITLTAPQGEGGTIDRLAFFPDQEGDIDDAYPQTLERDGRDNHLRIRLAAVDAPATALKGVLSAHPSIGKHHSAAVQLMPVIGPLPSHAPASGPLGPGLAVLFALLGGMILNLMPCVFPVLTIKILGVMERAHGSPALLRQHGLLYGAGVLTCFLIIGATLLWLRAQGAALGWGFQLQSPWVITGLTLLFFALALNMSGVFHFGHRIQALAGDVHADGARADAFASGLLAALVATPCTAPFMGAALGYAVTRPTAQAMGVFVAIAVGMALPYIALCYTPALMRRLPRPGRWMETLRQLLAFPLYATVIWLVWVLGQISGINGAAWLLVSLLFAGLALWCLGRLPKGSLVRHLGFALALIAAAVSAWPDGIQQGTEEISQQHKDQGRQAQAERQTAPNAIEWAAWSQPAVDEARRAGRAVFVDFTAAWCVSCQVNKRLVLNTDKVTRGLRAAGVVTMRADWTQRDPAITHALEKMGRSGVPVYALYLPGQAEPMLLPEILTTGVVLDALKQIPGRSARAPAFSLANKE